MTPDAPRPDLDEAERRLRHWVKTTDVLPWYFANELERHFVECDRRGAALADAQAEVARLRAAVDAVRELIPRLEYDGRGQAIECEAVTDEYGELLREALAAAPAPAEDGGSGDAEVWIPPEQDCMEHRHDKPCPHCGDPRYHHRTGRCGECGRRPGAPAAPASGVDTGAASPQHEEADRG